MLGTFLCDICRNGHNYTSRQRLEVHEKTAGHKQRLDANSGIEMISLGERCLGKFLCCVCGDGREYTTSQNLKRHENTAAHKRRLDPEFAASEEARKVKTKKEEAGKFLCGVCGDGREYTTAWRLKQHENTAAHKRRLDPEFAAGSCRRG